MLFWQQQVFWVLIGEPKRKERKIIVVCRLLFKLWLLPWSCGKLYRWKATNFIKQLLVKFVR